MNANAIQSRRAACGRLERAARSFLPLISLAAVVALSACDHDHHHRVDATAPAVPSGVGSITGDTHVYVYWTPNREADLAGYRIWTNSDGGSEYYLLDEIDAYDENFYLPGNVPANDIIVYDDYGLANGQEYWYAISAFDFDGNESELSYEDLRDVPRPEGETILNDAVLAPQFSGFDFSRAPVDDSAQPWDAYSTDVWLEYDQYGVPFLVTPLPDVNKEVLVQDYGYVSFDTLSWAPSSGWSYSGIVEAIAGHTYAFEIILDPQGAAISNYAKLTIMEIDGDSARVIWGYQEVSGERELAKPDEGGKHERRDLSVLDSTSKEVAR